MHEVKSIQDLLNQISRDEILLPEFQRGYVWNRDQVRGLMQSLYRKHPTGHLLIWRTYKPSLVRGGEAARDGHSLLLLDGQQRLTTLYVLFKGRAPRFYEGESLFFDLHFNMQTEEFRFWQKSRMENNPAWIGVHEFLQEGLTALLERLEQLDEERRAIVSQNLERLSAWEQMQPAFEHLVSVLRQEAFISGLDDLPTNFVLIPVTIYLARQGGQFPTDAVRRRFIRWIFLAGLWARYSGSTDTKLQQDVALVAGRDLDPTHELEEVILRERGRVKLQEGDLDRARIDSAVARLSRIVARHRDARDWFTGLRIYDPVTGTSVGEERHYIFPRRVLEKAGFDETTRINAVGNRALLGQPAPREYRGTSPAEYLPEVDEHQPSALRAQSIPMDRALWQPERFLDFLATRRRLLAEAMNEFIARWLPEAENDPEQHVRALIAAGESEKLEFKSSLRWDRREERVNKGLEGVVVKTLAGFLNAAGGTLLIGVDDAGAVVGVAADYGTLKKPDRDGFELHLQNVLARDLGEAVASSFLAVNFHEIDGQDICQITVEPSDIPIYVEHQKEAIFYLRVGNGTRALSVKEAVQYVGRRWGKTP